MFNKELVIIRGGGDISTGIIQKFHRAGFRVLVLETKQPLAIRKTVALCQAVYDKKVKVEDVVATLVEDLEGIETCWKNNEVPIIIDPAGQWIEKLKPSCVVDAILAKKNLGTHIDMASAVIGTGPGFSAGVDVDIVIETMRGHDLGRLIMKGETFPNTGIPGEIGGKSADRVIHAPNEGEIKIIKNIGDIVEKGQPVVQVGETIVNAPFTGLIRGMIENGLVVKNGLKIADIDPRTDVDCYTISDKARNIGGSALEAFLYINNGGLK